MLQVEQVNHRFQNGSVTIPVLHNIDFTVQQGEMIALLGSSGSGKSTLLNLMAGLMKPSEGSIKIANQAIETMNENQLAEFRRKHIGFIFQSYELIPHLNIQENVELPLVFQGMSPRIRKERSIALLTKAGLGDKLKMFPSQLSGGQQQRVSICRALITEPAVVFADEPTGNLDTSTESEIMALLAELNQTLGMTFVIVTHEQEVAKRTKRILFLKDGYITDQSIGTHHTQGGDPA